MKLTGVKKVLTALILGAALLAPQAAQADDDGRVLHTRGQARPFDVETQSKLGDDAPAVDKDLLDAYRGNRIEQKRSVYNKLNPSSALKTRSNETRSRLGQKGTELHRPTAASRLAYSPRLLATGISSASQRLSVRTGSTLTNRSRFFRTASRGGAAKSASAPAQVQPQVARSTTFAKQAYNYYVRVTSDSDGFFAYHDKGMGQDWKLRMATHPEVRQEGSDYIVQAGFHGMVGQDPHVFPVVLEFRMRGADARWQVADVEMASVNHVTRKPGATEFVVFGSDTYEPLADGSSDDSRS